jgi:hypothetical protein
MEITAYIKNVYGNDLIYIEDIEHAKAIRNLTGKRTINNNDIHNLSKLGIIITVNLY